MVVVDQKANKVFLCSIVDLLTQIDDEGIGQALLDALVLRAREQGLEEFVWDKLELAMAA